MSDEIAQRNREIVDRRRDGERLASIANAYGISKQRVHQILRQHGIGGVQKSLRRTVLRLVDEGRTLDEMAEITGRTRQDVSNVLCVEGFANTHGIQAEITRRHDEIVALYREGKSREEIADRVGKTRAYVNNVLNYRGIRERKVRRKPAEVEAIRPVIEAELRNHPNLKLVEIGRRHGVDWWLVQSIRNRMDEAA